MRKIILSLVMLFFLLPLAHAGTCEARSELSVKQMRTVERAYQAGLPHNLGYSLAAIVWQESSAGLFLINSSEGSYGPFQINLKTALARVDGKNWSKPKKDWLATNLLRFDFSVYFAIEELKYWQSVHGNNNWRKVWASYNGGWRYHKPAPQSYAQSIATKIQKLQGCFGEKHVQSRKQN